MDIENMDEGREEILSMMMEEFNKRSSMMTDAFNTLTSTVDRLNIELDEKNRSLQESLEKQSQMHGTLLSILETMGSGVIAVNMDGVITHFNRAAESITGYRREDLLYRSFSEVFSEKQFGTPTLLETLQTMEEHEWNEKSLWNCDGVLIPVAFQRAILRDISGVALGAVEIFSDLSRIKALESENNQNRVLAALGEMAATLAHEVKNPLGAIGNWARLLDRTIDSNTNMKGKELLAKITDALSRLNKIVSSMLVFGRQSNITEFRKLDIKGLLQEYADSMELEILFNSEKSVSMVTRWDSEPLMVSIECEKFRQILYNLVINAHQAIEQEGSITISCEAVESERGSFVCISVIDTGPGIEESELSNIFTPFHTTKENGTGLGLAIVKKLVDFHRGMIGIKSKLSVGTTFEIYLPRIK